MWSYEVATPLLLMIGALDDWTPPHYCEWLHGKVRRAQKDARFELIIFPDSRHGFDGYGPIQVRSGLPPESGSATLGSNPPARDKAMRRMFDFLSETFELPLGLTHEARFNGQRYVLPPDSGFARADDASAVPLSEKGRERYRHYLGLGAAKAFAITEKGGGFFRSDDTEAMRVVMEHCARSKVRCWLYAVDHRVVRTGDPALRTDAGKLERSAPPTKSARRSRVN